jgi:archaellum component FlaC
MLDEQQHKCKLSGMPIEFIRKANGNTASVDRIDSTIGYLQSNVQLLHRDVNMMKQSFTQSYFLEMCGRISK